MRLDLLACARSVSLVLCLAGAGSKMPRPGGSGLSPPANAAPRAAKTHVQGAVCVVRSPSCRLTTGARGSPPVKKAGPLFSDFGAAMRGVLKLCESAKTLVSAVRRGDGRYELLYLEASNRAFC